MNLQDAAKKYSETVQEKLKECIAKGGMNSFDRINSLFGNNEEMDTEDENRTTPGIEAMDTKQMNESTKFNVSTKKHKFTNDEGNYTGKTLARKKVNRMKRRGQMKTIVKTSDPKKRVKRTKVSF
jgi:hypothetical protein